MTYAKGNLICEGKTKKLWEVKGDPDLVIVENKEDITAFDDPKFTQRFETKAVYATTTTCRVFELLKACGIPVAYLEQLSPTEFLSPVCHMIPLEIVARRYAVGSYLSRNPQLRRQEGELPYRFHRMAVEFFLKTTKGELRDQNGQILVEGLDPEKGEEDPLIMDPECHDWRLFHSKKPIWEKEADLKKTIKSFNFPEL